MVRGIILLLAVACSSPPPLVTVASGPVPTEELSAIRFVVLGDTGTGSEAQYRVAKAIKNVCAKLGGCDLALLLGDNIYEFGVKDVADAQWQEKFERPYAELAFPFYAVLGNHDYGDPEDILGFAAGIGVLPERAQAEIDYTQYSQKFRLPAPVYQFSVGPVEFSGLNTNAVFWSDMNLALGARGFNELIAEQNELLSQWEPQSSAFWRIAFGHHPYLSNGTHGNAGAYGGATLRAGSGKALKQFFDARVIGHFDVYFSGHDHDLQDLGNVGGTELLVSGAGAKLTELIGTNPTFYETSQLGFVIVEASRTDLHFIYVVVSDTGEGIYVHEREITR